MKLISYNIRGLGGTAKKNENRNQIQSHKPDIICIQETKMEAIKRSTCDLMWSSSNNNFEFKPSTGRSGGILSIWDNNVFTEKKKHIKEHILWLEGEWGEDEKLVSIVNVYGPCDARRI